MATSKESNNHQPTEVSEWKKASKGQPLEVPSGNTALVRKTGMQTLVQRGMIPNALMPIVQQAISGKQAELDLSQIDMEQLPDLLGLIDVIVVAACVEPKVHPVPPDDEARDDSKLYVDEVEDDDKMYIYSWCMGTVTDLESFRKQQADALAGLSPGADVAGTAK